MENIQLIRKQQVGIKTEAAQGTAETLAATDMILAYDVNITPMVSFNGQNYVSSSLSRFKDIPGKKWYDIEMTIPFKASGSAGVANVPLGAALMASGMSETIVAVTSTTYAFVSSRSSSSFPGPGKGCTVKIYQDGMLHVAAGCMFNVTFEMVNGLIVGIKLKGKGKYAAVTDVAFPTFTGLTNDPPVFKSASFLMQTYAATFEKIAFDFGNVIAEIPGPNDATNVENFVISKRDLSGSFDPNSVLVASHDFWGKMMSGAEGALTTVLGAGAGSIITITAPKVQYGQIKPGDRDGVRTLDIPLMFNRNAGDDELVIAMT